MSAIVTVLSLGAVARIVIGIVMFVGLATSYTYTQGSLYLVVNLIPSPLGLQHLFVRLRFLASRTGRQVFEFRVTKTQRFMLLK